jgi:hypothetical protein
MIELIVLVVLASVIGWFFESEKNCLGGCSVVTIIVAVSAWGVWWFLTSDERQNEGTREQMLELCFKATPRLETTLNKLQAEINRWSDTKKEFTNMRDASQTEGGRLLAKEKLAKVDEVLNELKRDQVSVLEQVEMIAIESTGQITDLDRVALEELSNKVEGSVRDARELREGLAGD